MHRQVGKPAFPGLAVRQNRSLVQNTGMQEQNAEAPKTRHSSVHLPKIHDKPFGFYPVNTEESMCGVGGRGKGDGGSICQNFTNAARNGNGRVKNKAKESLSFLPLPPPPHTSWSYSLEGNSTHWVLCYSQMPARGWAVPT